MIIICNLHSPQLPWFPLKKRRSGNIGARSALTLAPCARADHDADHDDDAIMMIIVATIDDDDRQHSRGEYAQILARLFPWGFP